MSGTLAALLVEVAPIEPDPFAAGVVAIALAAAVAVLIPTLRAIAIDPSITLKAE